MSFTAFVALLLAGLFAFLYFILSSFAHAIESLSDIRRKALVEEEPDRFGRVLSGTNEGPSRIAARLTAQGAVLGGSLRRRRRSPPSTLRSRGSSRRPGSWSAGFSSSWRSSGLSPGAARRRSSWTPPG